MSDHSGHGRFAQAVPAPAGRRRDAGRAAERAMDAVVGDRSRSGRWLASVAGGAIAFPIAVLVHELGHFGAFAAFGFPDPVLRYSSTSWSGSGEFDRLIRAGDVEAATALVQPWQMAVGVAAGVMVTYLTIIACVFAVRRFGPGPLSLVLGVGLVTPLRWLGAIPIFVSRLRGRLQSTSNTDEGWLAALTGIPETLLLLLGLTCLVLGYWFLVTAIPRGRRMHVVVPTLVGAVAVGGPLWVLWLGPLMLP